MESRGYINTMGVLPKLSPSFHSKDLAKSLLCKHMEGIIFYLDFLI
jgi:hypothetical protein